MNIFKRFIHRHENVQQQVAIPNMPSIREIRDVVGLDGDEWNKDLDRALNAILFNTDGVRYRQRRLGVTVDGIWGRESENARASVANRLITMLNLKEGPIEESKEKILSENTFRDHDTDEDYVYIDPSELDAGDDLDSTQIVDEGAPE